MLTRRDILTCAAAASIGAFVPLQRAASLSGQRIRSVIRRDETTVHLGGSGDNWHMSWTRDDRQVVSLCDGYGWSDAPKGMYNSKLLSIAGGPQKASFHDVPGYPDLIPAKDETRYYNFGTLAVEGRIYQFLSTLNHPYFRPGGTTPWPDMRFIGAKLIYSPDDGRTWYNQNDTTPIVWPSWKERSHQTLTFFQEDQNAFSLLSIAQMGRDYGANRDGYIYVYSPNGSADGTMNELVMFRVRKDRLLDRSAYEYFARPRADGGAHWVKDLKARGVMHTFPRGWVNKIDHPWAWMPSVTYNVPLGVFLMTSWGTASASDGTWFARPSYLGFWAARYPWGPWTQIHEETAWTPSGDPGARAFAPQISPKWVAEDGKSFWLVWSDYQHDKPECKRLAALSEYKAGETTEETLRRAALFRGCLPMYSFHAQRVDLVL